jgi:hypothetical protein
MRAGGSPSSSKAHLGIGGGFAATRSALRLPILGLGCCLLPATLLPDNQPPILPKPDFSNTFYVGVGCRNYASLPIEEQTAFARETFQRLGLPRLYVRGEFTNGTSDYRASLACDGFMSIGGTTCARDRHRVPPGDLRFFQWLNDGKVGRNESGICLSRYAEKAGAWEAALADTLGRAHIFLTHFNAGKAVRLGAPREPRIAEEWRDGGLHFGDYSPFAVAEFRDYLTHRGDYGPGGKTRGQGRPGGEAFAEDPSPAQKRPGRTGKTFNETYATGFKTWELLYWDLDRFANPLPDGAPGMPGPGQEGRVEAGFDAPRVNKASAKPPEPYWLAWHCNDEKTPGFCQLMVKRYTESMARRCLEAGVPASRIFTSNRSYESDKPVPEFLAGADPNWVADIEGFNIGYSAYGKHAFDEGLFKFAAARAPDWGLLEYHPFPLCPGGHSIQEYLESLNLLRKHRCHFIPLSFTWDDCFGGNRVDGGQRPTSFRLQAQETPFEDAVAAFVDALPDQPYANPRPVDYAPPDVHGARLARERDGNILLAWSRLIWPDDVMAWSAWRDFDHFDVVSQAPGQAPQRIAGTRDCFLSLKGVSPGTLSVRAVSRKQAAGAPSERVRWDPEAVTTGADQATACDRADAMPKTPAPFVHPAKRIEISGGEYWSWRKEAGEGAYETPRAGAPIPVIFLHGEGTWGRMGVELLRRLVDLHDPANAHRYLVLSPHVEPFHLEGCADSYLYFVKKDHPWFGRKRYDPETAEDTVRAFLKDAKKRFPELKEGVILVAQGAGAISALEILRDKEIRVKRILFWAATQPAPNAPEDPMKRPFVLAGKDKPEVTLLWPEKPGQIRSYLKGWRGEPRPPQPSSVKQALDQIGLAYAEETLNGANDYIDDAVGKRIVALLSR